MIEAWHVREALRSRFGSALVDQPGIWDRAASLLQHYAPYRDTFEGLAAQLEDVIFNTVYEQLGPSMGARMEDGSVRRIRSAEMKDAADDVMGVLFDSLKVYSVNYDALHESQAAAPCQEVIFLNQCIQTLFQVRRCLTDMLHDPLLLEQIKHG